MFIRRRVAIASVTLFLLGSAAMVLVADGYPGPASRLTIVAAPVIAIVALLHLDPYDDPAGQAVELAVAVRARVSLSDRWAVQGHRLGHGIGIGVAYGYATLSRSS